MVIYSGKVIDLLFLVFLLPTMMVAQESDTKLQFGTVV